MFEYTHAALPAESMVIPSAPMDANKDLSDSMPVVSVAYRYVFLSP